MPNLPHSLSIGECWPHANILSHLNPPLILCSGACCAGTLGSVPCWQRCDVSIIAEDLMLIAQIFPGREQYELEELELTTTDSTLIAEMSRRCGASA